MVVSNFFILTVCQCYGHAVSCHYDDSVGGGVCDNCTHDTTGNNCELCEEFYYRNTSKLLNDPEICISKGMHMVYTSIQLLYTQYYNVY